jgi:hypothetical protein
MLRRWPPLRPAVAVALAIAALLPACLPAAAQAPDRFRSNGHFIEFRSRPSQYFGHTFVIYGRTDEQGRVVEQHHAGLVPEGNLAVGIVVPIPATVGRYAEDVHVPSNAVYRRRLTAGEYDRVVRVVNIMRTPRLQWHGIFFNCNEFAIQVAEALQMRRPPGLVPPNVWVDGLRLLNER